MDASFEIAPEQIERRQHSIAFVIGATGTPAGSHDACNAIWPLNGDMHGADRLLFLPVRTSHACDADAEIGSEALAYRMSHSARGLLTYRAVRLQDSTRHTHLRLQFAAIGYHPSHKIR